jgi:hypothetical protein
VLLHRCHLKICKVATEGDLIALHANISMNELRRTRKKEVIRVVY